MRVWDQPLLHIPAMNDQPSKASNITVKHQLASTHQTMEAKPCPSDTHTNVLGPVCSASALELTVMQSYTSNCTTQQSSDPRQLHSLQSTSGWRDIVHVTDLHMLCMSSTLQNHCCAGTKRVPISNPKAVQPSAVSFPVGAQLLLTRTWYQQINVCRPHTI